MTWEVSNYEPFGSVAIMEDGEVIANLNDVKGSYEERLARARQIVALSLLPGTLLRAVNGPDPDSDAEREKRTYFYAGFGAGQEGYPIMHPVTLDCSPEHYRDYAYGFASGDKVRQRNKEAS